MGILSSVLKVALPVLAAGLGFGAAEEIGEQVIQAVIPPSPTKVVQAGVVAPVLAAAGPFAPIPVGIEATQMSQALPAGRGQIQTRTIVERWTPAGQLISRQTLKGSPYLMNREVASLRKVVGRIRRLERRLPKARAKISEKRVDDRVQQIAQTGQLFRALDHGRHN